MFMRVIDEVSNIVKLEQIDPSTGIVIKLDFTKEEYLALTQEELNDIYKKNVSAFRNALHDTPIRSLRPLVDYPSINPTTLDIKDLIMDYIETHPRVTRAEIYENVSSPLKGHKSEGATKNNLEDLVKQGKLEYAFAPEPNNRKPIVYQKASSHTKTGKN